MAEVRVVVPTTPTRECEAGPLARQRQKPKQGAQAEKPLRNRRSRLSTQGQTCGSFPVAEERGEGGAAVSQTEPPEKP